MSDSPAEPPSPPPIPPPPRHGCLTAFMAMAGIVLLLPGLCALYFASTVRDSRDLAGLTPFIVVGVLAGIAGGVLIWSAIRGPRS